MTLIKYSVIISLMNYLKKTSNLLQQGQRVYTSNEIKKTGKYER